MIDDKTMASLQDLSRLRLTPEEEKNLARQLEGILGYFDLLSAYDTEGIDPDLGVEVDPPGLREDRHRLGVDTATIESFAPNFNDGFFVVPKILGDDTDA